jgi:macrolide-specific efflux system membrane fusion protein
VKVVSADDSRNQNVIEREVLVGVSSRVNAEIVSGLKEGERIVAGIKVPEAPPRTAAQTKGATPALAPQGAAGGFRR